MIKIERATSSKSAYLLTTLAFVIAGCGGGGGSSSGSTGPADSASAPAAGSVQIPTEASVAPPTATLPSLPVPTNIADGSVVELTCGRTYQGTLDLRNKINVTVRTAGSCGKAVITPGQPVNGWSQHQGNIYSADIPFSAAQVLISGQPQSLAHWPNRPQTWAKASSSTANSISYPMPNNDLAGANLVFRPFEWAIDARRITASSGGTMNLASTGNPAYDGYAVSGQVDFYVEGKLWMLDEPGEWAVSDGRLYVWAADGHTPEGRTWASPDRHGIDASDSKGVAIEGVRIYGAANGIHAMGASNLQVSDVEIVNSSENGIVNSGGSGLTVDGASIRNSRHDAITVHWGGGNETIRNSKIEASGVIGMPTSARSAINLTVGTGANVVDNSVTNSGYIGIRAFRNAVIARNFVDGTCHVLTDCGGIFTSARDKQPLNTRIEGNTVQNVGPAQRHAWGIYLGDSANGVSVINNIVTGSGNGMNFYDAFGNTVSGNMFSRSTQAHIQMAESSTAPTVRNNVFTGNTFTSAHGEESYRISSPGGTASVAQFGSYNGNTYRSSSAIFANFNGEALSFTQWKARTGQDASSTYQAP